MDYKQGQTSETSTKPSSLVNYSSRNLSSDQHFTHFESSLCFDVGTEQNYPEFTPPLDQAPPTHSDQPNHDIKRSNQSNPIPPVNSTLSDCDQRAMLSNLSFLEQKIRQVQDIVRSTTINREGQFSIRSNELAAQQQLVTADLTCIIIQLISTAGSLLPSIKNTLLSTRPVGLNSNSHQSEGFKTKALGYEEHIKGIGSHGGEGSESIPFEEHDAKDLEDGGGQGENLPPGSYEVLQLEKEEILAPHTHFCLICGKGFKRDANLRMHMRGHGDEYKTPAALAKPGKELNSEPALIKRYSCPFAGCRRNRDHKKFQPLKTILCVKNHYKRSHCDKRHMCSRCNSKKFSVIADLKTHEKHCGRDKWLCSCGTSFSRKDKLFGHVALFQAHTPALGLHETKGGLGTWDRGRSDEATTGVGCVEFNLGGSSLADDVGALGVQGVEDDPGFFSPINFDSSCNFGGLNE